MSILINEHTQILVQGITGTQASFHTRKALAAGTKIKAGVSPQRGGMQYLGVPVFNTVAEAVQSTNVQASVMFVPARFVKDAVREVVENEIKTAVAIADGVPIRDMLEIKAMLKGSQTIFIGPNTPGVITPGGACLGIFPENIHTKGEIGLVSRSSTLTYEAVLETERAGFGQSTVVGLGDDMIVGTGFVEMIKRFQDDPQTKAMVLIGKLGGMYEEEAAAYYASLSNPKPIISYIAGSLAAFNDKMGYAGDVITHGRITAEDKKKTMRAAKMIVVDNINEIHVCLRNLEL